MIEKLKHQALESENPGESLLQIGLYLLSKEVHGAYQVYAHEFFEEAIKHQNVDALYELGMCYRWGDGGVYADGEEAMKYFREAAKANHEQAKQLVAYYYNPEGINMLTMSAMNGAQGQGVYWYKVKFAVDYYYQKANEGDGECQYELARQLADPNHYGPFKYNINEAIYWYEKACENHIVDAMYNLGKLYLQGADGLSIDKQKAFDYFKMCADHGDEEAKQIILKKELFQ